MEHNINLPHLEGSLTSEFKILHVYALRSRNSHKSLYSHMREMMYFKGQLQKKKEDIQNAAIKNQVMSSFANMEIFVGIEKNSIQNNVSNLLINMYIHTHTDIYIYISQAEKASRTALQQPKPLTIKSLKCDWSALRYAVM